MVVCVCVCVQRVSPIRCSLLTQQLHHQLHHAHTPCTYQAYLTFVALRDGKPAVVPGAVPETPLEHAWNEAAEVRRSERIARKKRQSKEIKAKAAGVSVRDEEEYVHFDRQLQRRWSCEAGAVSLPRVVQERQQHGPWHGEHGGGVPSTHSYTRNVQLIMPQHANSLGVTFGVGDNECVRRAPACCCCLIIHVTNDALVLLLQGHIIRLMERCAVVSAARHTQKAAVATDVAPVTDDKTRNGTATAMTTPMAIATTSPNALVFRTASIDSLNFLMPTRVGDLITIRASVSRAFHSSLEVYVTVHASTMHTKAFADDPASSTVHHARTDPTRDCGPLTSEWTMTNDGYLTVVAFAEPSQSMHKRQESNDDGDDAWRRGTSVMPPQSPTIMQDTPHGQVPPVLPQTELEQWRYACAEERRERRLRERDELKEVYLST